MAEDRQTGIKIGITSVSNSLFGNIGKSIAKDNYELQSNLLKSHSDMLPGVYAAYSLLMVLIVTFISLLISAIIGFAVIPLMESNWEKGTNEETFETIYWEAPTILGFQIGTILILLSIFGVPYLTWRLMMKLPRMRIGMMAPNIDRKLPYAATFVAAMAAANATPDKIFKALAMQENVYGLVSREATLIYRDLTYLGKDLVSTLKMSVERAPSEKLAEFFQGIVGTITAGGNLKLYFLNRAEYYSQENRVRVKMVIDTLALFAESYVVAAVAMPIFLMIIMVITLWVQTSGFTMDKTMLYLIVFAMLPLMQISYSALFYMYSKDVA